MKDAHWPTSAEVHSMVGQRLRLALGEQPGPVADVARRLLAEEHGLLAPEPHSLTAVLVPGACLAAGGNWRLAAWPAVAAECMMTAADLFDDAADADAEGDTAEPGGLMLTAAAGLLSLAGASVVRVVEDGVSAETAVALAKIFGRGFLSAANGQATNLRRDQAANGDPDAVDALSAYRQAAAKSGPLGSVIARLGARTATDDLTVVDLLGEFGRRLAVRSQLLNDARDAAPDPTTRKADVRAGALTVPLVFAGSAGAPSGLNQTELELWEANERLRVESRGGLTAAIALAEAERLRAAEALDQLEALGHGVSGLRALIR